MGAYVLHQSDTAFKQAQVITRESIKDPRLFLHNTIPLSLWTINFTETTVHSTHIITDTHTSAHIYRQPHTESHYAWIS